MSVREINASDAKTMLEAKTTALADIRDAASFANGHVSGALHLTNETIGSFLQSADKSTPLIVYCYHGNMSKEASQYFMSQGFAEVYSLAGGFEAWQQNYPDDVVR